MSPLPRAAVRSVPIARAAALLAAGMLLLGCPAVYPEIGTRTRSVRATQVLDPPPPDDIRWIQFASAKIPEKRRDGEAWRAGGKPPDPYAKLLVNGKELIRTPVQSGTFAPTWPTGPKGNFQIGAQDKLRVELWDATGIADAPIGIQEIGHPSDDALANQQITVDFDAGGQVVITFQRAHALLGLGLWFELRSESCYITRMLEGSPAERAGLQPLDEVLKLGDRDVSKMSSDEVRSAFNAVPAGGLAMTVKHANGATLIVTLKEGPIYPVFDQFGSVD
jgi:hypothetical protein